MSKHLNAAAEYLEPRLLLSAGDLYPELVPTVGVYDENAIQTNTVDSVATGSSMTDVEFAARLATAWANNDGGVIDGTGQAQVFGFGQDLINVFHILPDGDTDWILGTPTDRQATSGTGAFATTYAASVDGYNVLTQWMGVEAVYPDRQVLEFGLTVLGQTLEDYGTVYLYGHLAFGEDMVISHQVLSGQAEDVFYGLTAPSADYFIGFSLAYAPEGEWIVDKPLWIDDFGFIAGDYLAGGNQAPTAYDDAYTLEAGTSLTAFANSSYPGNGVLANDVDPESHDLHAVRLSSPSHGTLDWMGHGGFTYTPDEGFFGTDSFTYLARDLFNGSSNVATVTFTVTPDPDSTYALNDAYTLVEDGTITVDSPGVLANDHDGAGQALTALLVSGPSDGTLTLENDGSFLYTPNVNFHGTDTFTYQAIGTAQSNIATVTLTVERANATPVAAAESYELNKNTTLTIGGSGVLANDTDQDGEPLTAQLVSGPESGFLTFNPDGTFSYTPAVNFHGPVSFTYRASDGTAVSDPVTVTLNVLNAAPVANDDSYTVGEDEFLFQPASPVVHLTMVSEPGDYIGQGQTYDLDQTDGNFTASRNDYNGVSIHYNGGLGNWWDLRFAAPGGVPLTAGVYTGATRYPFQAPGVPGMSISGQGRGSNTLTGEFTVHEVVYGPNGEVLVFEASFEQHSEGFEPALTGHIRFVAAGTGGVLANDSDTDGDALSAVLVSGPNHGVLTLNADGSFLYSPDANFHGTDTFTYQTSDGTALSNNSTVTISVLPANDPPSASSQSLSTDEDSAYSGSVSGTDVDGDSLQFTLADGPAHGSLVFNSDGTFSYAPDMNFHGSDSFTFVAHDGTIPSEAATVTISVLPVNDVPTANGQAISSEEDSPLSGSVTGADIEGDSLEFTLANGPSHGTLVFNVDGTFTYTPDMNFHGSDSFTFVAHDGTIPSEAADVTITVNPVNDAPTLSGTSFNLAENSVVDTTVGTVAGVDVDGDLLSYQIVGGNTSGAFAIDTATGVIRVANSLPLDFETTPEFVLTIQAADGEGRFATATVIVRLTDVSETLILTIDILPGDSANTISSSGNGRKEVAILSTADFDVHDLDIASLRFGRTGTENSLRWKQGKPEYRYEDVNDDGLLDIIVLFERDLMGFLAGDTEGFLTGQTLDGTDVGGSDDVNLTGYWPS